MGLSDVVFDALEDLRDYLRTGLYDGPEDVLLSLMSHMQDYVDYADVSIIEPCKPEFSHIVPGVVARINERYGVHHQPLCGWHSSEDDPREVVAAAQRREQ